MEIRGKKMGTRHMVLQKPMVLKPFLSGNPMQKINLYLVIRITSFQRQLFYIVFNDEKGKINPMIYGCRMKKSMSFSKKV